MCSFVFCIIPAVAYLYVLSIVCRYLQYLMIFSCLLSSACLQICNEHREGQGFHRIYISFVAKNICSRVSVSVKPTI